MKLATLCYVKDNDRTLMLHRVKRQKDIHQGKWNGLGGKFEAGETPEDCVIREVWEESGLLIRDPQLIGFLTFPRFKDDEDWYVFVYVARHFTGTLKMDTPEGVLEWIDDDKLEDLNLWEGDPIFFRWMRQGRFFSAAFEYVRGELKTHRVTFHDPPE